MCFPVGISTACLYPMKTESALQVLLDLGCRVFEVFLNAYEETQPAFLSRLKQRAEAVGGVFTSVHPFTSAMEGMLLFDDYERRTQEGFELYRRFFEAAAYLGAPYVVIHGLRTSLPLAPASGTDRLYWARFGQLTRLGRAHGALPAQENVVYHKSAAPAFVTGMRHALGDDCAFVLDVKQCRAAKVPVSDMVLAMGSRLKHVHLSDCRGTEICLLPGHGDFDLPAFRAQLCAQQYRGALVTEVFRHNFHLHTALGESLQKTRAIFS